MADLKPSKKEPPTPEATLVEAKRLHESAFPLRTAAALVSVIDRTTPEQRLAQQADLAGEYRVVHGSVAVPIPLEQRLLPNNTENEHLPKQFYAQPGDVIWVDSHDARSMLEHGVIEPLDARPSHVGKGCLMDEYVAKKLPWDFATLKRLRDEKAAKAAGR